MTTVNDVFKRAHERAKSLNTSLAKKVISAEALHERYDQDPLDITVPFLGAFLRGRPDMLLFVKQRWFASAGYQVEVSGLRLSVGGHVVPDADGFSPSQIASSNVPEIHYIWLVDWIRFIQSILYFIPELLGWELDRLDLWGALVYKSGTGGDVFILPMVTHPLRTHRILKQWCATIESGAKAMGQLVERADAGKLPEEGG